MKILLLLCTVISLMFKGCVPTIQLPAPTPSCEEAQMLPSDFEYTIFSVQYNYYKDTPGIYQLTPEDDAFSLLSGYETPIRDFIYVPEKQVLFALTFSNEILTVSLDSSSKIELLNTLSLEDGETATNIDFAAEIASIFILTTSRILEIPLSASDSQQTFCLIPDNIKNWTMRSFSISPDGTKYIINPSYEGYCFDAGNETETQILSGSYFRFLTNTRVVYSNGRSVSTYDFQTDEAMLVESFDKSIYGLSCSADGYIMVWTGESGLTGGAGLSSMYVVDIAAQEKYLLPLTCSELRLTYAIILETSE